MICQQARLNQRGKRILQKDCWCVLISNTARTDKPSKGELLKLTTKQKVQTQMALDRGLFKKKMQFSPLVLGNVDICKQVPAYRGFVCHV